jgi:hypothetical protein
MLYLTRMVIQETLTFGLFLIEAFFKGRPQGR